MAEYAVNLNNGKTDEKGQFRLLGKLLNQSGVIESTGLTVSATTPTPDMTVKVSGSVANDNAVFITTNGDTYHGWNTAQYSVTILSNATGVTHYDAIIAYIDTAAGGATSNNPGGLKFIAVRSSAADGTTKTTSADIAGTAVGTKPYLRLADVTVGNGVSSINSGNIVDTRPRAGVAARALTTVVNSGTISKPLNDSTVTGLVYPQRVGTTGNGTYNIAGDFNISSLNIPATALILNYEFWVAGVGNTNNQGAVRALVFTLSTTTLHFECQISGNDTGFPNLTNSTISGYVRYIT